ncbi:GTP cyclohydrolase II [Simiduia sp. 21SJ11W-1]|uniref:GTP cyclohydrolase II n=1 Tax=Simiduia sp. 21SJ11W-1 TaxID=2909669 RepID=UPI00209E005D|nr:GTP cyclohydrolase II [Simiduia sp. 21SJ11W-1]UTA47518.1 GTP cyclohydrolase II [Simiduia sp. 21SJ11W-1]
MTIRYIESSRLPTPWGTFDMHGFEDPDNNKEHLVLTMGDVRGEEPVLARIHSECLTGDALFSLRCDCGAQLQAAMHKIAQTGRGAIFYLRQEGRGIGLLNKIRAYKLQDCGADTVEANEALGFGADMRDYSILKPMLEHLAIERIRLMTNNPRKVKAFQDLGIPVVERLSHQTGRNPHNLRYLETKKGKLGHLFNDQQDD